MGFVKDVRLPRHVLPDSYIITLIPFLVEGNYTVHGLVEINAHIVDAPNSCENKVRTDIEEKNLRGLIQYLIATFTLPIYR